MLHFRRWLIAALVVLPVVLGGGACTREEKADERVFAVRGIVRAPYADGAIVIEHETIPDFMPAMTMPFYAEPAEVAGLAPGDRVEFEFRVGAETSRATRFRRVGRDGPEPRATAAATGARRAPRLRPGDTLPPFRLVDQEGGAITAEALRGRHTVLTFIFTRCPVPEFCPLIGRKFQTLQAELGNRPGLPASEVQLLSITIDPEYDTPEVLRAYGESLGADFERWRFATGAPEEVEKLRRAFAVHAERSDASLDHTLATALIAPDGAVVEIWRGNGWKPEEIVERMRGLAERG